MVNNETTPLRPDSLLGEFMKAIESQISETSPSPEPVALFFLITFDEFILDRVAGWGKARQHFRDVAPPFVAHESLESNCAFRCAMLASQGWKYKLQYFPLCHAGEPRIVIQTTVLSVVPCWRARDGNTNYSTFRCAMLASQG